MGAFGSRSRKATTEAVSCRISAGISRAAIRQKTQSVETRSLMAEDYSEGPGEPISCSTPRQRPPPAPEGDVGSMTRAPRLFVALVGAALVSSLAIGPAAAGSRRMTAPWRRSRTAGSTPALIEAAVARGEISRDTADRYLAQALANPSTAPLAVRRLRSVARHPAAAPAARSASGTHGRRIGLACAARRARRRLRRLLGHQAEEEGHRALPDPLRPGRDPGRAHGG